MRLARWARHPPSARRVRLMAAVAAICALIWGIEYLGWWPAALTTGGWAGFPKN